jgi:hypothetical protein
LSVTAQSAPAEAHELMRSLAYWCGPAGGGSAMAARLDGLAQALIARLEQGCIATAPAEQAGSRCETGVLARWRGIAVRAHLALDNEFVTIRVTLAASEEDLRRCESIGDGVAPNPQLCTAPWVEFDREVLSEPLTTFAAVCNGPCVADVRVVSLRLTATSNTGAAFRDAATRLGFGTAGTGTGTADSHSFDPGAVAHLAHSRAVVDSSMAICITQHLLFAVAPDSANVELAQRRLQDLLELAGWWGASLTRHGALQRATEVLPRLEHSLDACSVQIEDTLRSHRSARREDDPRTDLNVIDATLLSLKRRLGDLAGHQQQLANARAVVSATAPGSRALLDIEQGVVDADRIAALLAGLQLRIAELRRHGDELARLRQQQARRSLAIACELVVLLVLLPICLTQLAHMAGADLRRYVLPWLPEGLRTLAIWQDSQRSNARLILCLCTVLLLWRHRNAWISATRGWLGGKRA